MPDRFLQIHTLTSYPATLLNRDDAGFAKRLPLGGRVRTRISSQCLKRHWRRDDGEFSLATVPGKGGDIPMTVRSRQTFDIQIFQPLVAEGIDQAMAHAVTEALIGQVLMESKSAKAKKDAAEGEASKGDDLHTGQVVVLGRPEVEFLLEQARKAAAEHEDPKAAVKAIKADFKGEAKKNLAEMRHGAGLDSALFGRMVTSDVLARCDAAIHVAHAFTVHAEEVESDYFSAVDDLLQESGELGSGHINSTELTSGLYYGYVVVDVPLLVSNLTGCAQSDWQQADRSLAGEVVRRLLNLIATVSPGAKLGSTAPYSYADLMLVEAGNAAPRTLANAFLKPVQTGTSGPRKPAYQALARHLEEFDAAYGSAFERQALAVGPKQELTQVVEIFTNLPRLAEWAAERVES